MLQGCGKYNEGSIGGWLFKKIFWGDLEKEWAHMSRRGREGENPKHSPNSDHALSRNQESTAQMSASGPPRCPGRLTF